MKKHFWAILLAFFAAVLGVAVASATGDGDESADDTADNVFLGEQDLAERMEIWRNQFRRMTPGDMPLVQDVGTWPAAWEEFSHAWAVAPAERDLATWLVPVTAARSGALTVLRDANGTVLWNGATDFAKDESASVTLTGSLVDEEEWPLYEAAREEVERRYAEAFSPVYPGGMRGTNGPYTNGLRFTDISVDTNGDYRLDFAWETNGDVQVFCRAMHYECWTNFGVVWTNDENEVITNDVVNWTQVPGERFNGTSDTWDLLGVATVTNGSGSITDTNHVPEYDRVRFYAAAQLVDTDGDGLTDGEEWLQSHTQTDNSDSDGDGVGDAIDTTPNVSNVWWIVKTTNEVRYWEYVGNQQSWNGPPAHKYTTNVVGASPASVRVVKDVRIDGYVDDLITIDSVDVNTNRGPKTFSDLSITNICPNLQSGELALRLFDYPSQGHSGHNEVCLGITNGEPFRVMWEWWVPMDFRLEHINASGNPLVVNPSGTRPNREFTCEATLLPTNFPETNIFRSCTNAGMSFVGGVTNGRTVQLKGTQLSDWEATVTVQDNTNELFSAKLRGTVLERKTVPVHLHIVRKNDGTEPASTVTHFNDLLYGVNQIHEQSGIEFTLASPVLYTNKTEWLEISTNNDYAEYGQLQSWSSNTCGIEVYCINRFDGVAFNGLTWTVANAKAGVTITTNATVRTLAHELGHACGLSDIYEKRTIGNQTIALSTNFVQQSWAPQDWCDDLPNGGYGPLQQKQLLHRLLMYGIGETNAVEIPAGPIHGIDQYGAETNLGVGLSSMERQPQSW